MAVHNGTAVDIDDILRQSKFADDDEHYRGESLVDLGPLDVGKLPAGAIQSLANRWDRSKAETARLDRATEVLSTHCGPCLFVPQSNLVPGGRQFGGAVS